MCLHYRRNPRKEFLLSMQYKYHTIVVPFLYGPILPQRSHFIVGLWWATGPTLPQYRPNFIPNYEVMMSRWIFSVLFELITVNWNHFHRWFSEVAPVSWHINFISSSYHWGVRARFVIFVCSLPPISTSTPSPFSGLSPLSSKIFGTPQVTQFFGGPTPLPFNKGGGSSNYADHVLFYLLLL